MKPPRTQEIDHPRDASIRAPSETLHFPERKIGKISSSKFKKPLAVTAILGIFDGLQAKYMTIGNLGQEEAVAYQVVFMLIAAGAAYFFLFDERRSLARNLSNLLLAVPLATIADNISIDVQTLRPYFLLIPKDGYLWRIDVFGQTFLSPLAHWVNSQPLVPGLINGYIASFGLLAGYFVLQHFWIKNQT